MCRRVSVETTMGRADRMISELVAQENDAALQRFGIRVIREGENLFIYVASAHPELKSIYKDTKWCGGWAKSLARVPGSHGGGRFYFGGTRQRCVKIPVNQADLLK